VSGEELTRRRWAPHRFAPAGEKEPPPPDPTFSERKLEKEDAEETRAKAKEIKDKYEKAHMTAEFAAMFASAEEERKAKEREVEEKRILEARRSHPPEFFESVKDTLRLQAKEAEMAEEEAKRRASINARMANPPEFAPKGLADRLRDEMEYDPDDSSVGTPDSTMDDQDHDDDA
jgi:hypothetical protein